MSIVEPGLRFWLDYLEAEGGAWEPQSQASALAILPDHLQASLDLAEECLISSDPELAREEGGILMIPGHPALDAAASQVLDRGDVGISFLRWPTRPLPKLDTLVERAREQVPADHGRIYPGEDSPCEMYLPVLRLGVMVNYVLSLEDRFQERDEVWVDATSGQVLNEMSTMLNEAVPEVAPPGSRHLAPADLQLATAAGHRALQARAELRCAELGRQLRSGRDRQLARTAGYYQGVLESIARRRASATPERARLLDSQAKATRAEQARRIAEVEEGHRPEVQIRPFRLHLVGVPALELSVHMRRGRRTYPIGLTWVLDSGSFTIKRCLHCGAADHLVAGRERMGCRACLPKPVVPAPGPTHPSELFTGLNQADVADRAPAKGVGEPSKRGPSGKSGEAGCARSHSAAPSGTAPAARSGAKAPGGRQPAAPPTEDRLTTRRIERTCRTGNKMAVTFWEAATGEVRWRNRQVHPQSPLACLQRMYGAPGALLALGLEPGDLPDYISAMTAEPVAGQLETTSGWLTVVGSPLRYPFSLRWEMVAAQPVVAEVLPYPFAVDRRLLSESYLAHRTVVRLHHPPEPRVALDGLEELLWKTGIREFGLPLAARSLAMREWALLRHDLDYPDQELAGALLYVALKRAGRPITLDSAASSFGVTKADLTQITHVLQQLLRAEPRHW